LTIHQLCAVAKIFDNLWQHNKLNLSQLCAHFESPIFRLIMEAGGILQS